LIFLSFGIPAAHGLLTPFFTAYKTVSDMLFNFTIEKLCCVNACRQMVSSSEEWTSIIIRSTFFRHSVLPEKIFFS